MNGSIAGLFARVFDGGAYQPLIPAPALALAMTLAACIAIVGISLKSIAHRDGQVSADHVFALALLAAQLVSPLGWIYYLWLAAGPLLAMWLTRAQPFKARDVALWLALPGLLWPLPLFTVAALAWWQPLTLRSIYTWATLWLWVAVVLEIGRATFPSSLAPDSRSGR